MANQVPSLQVLATVANPRILEDPSIPKKTSEHVIQTIAIERFSQRQADGSIKLGLEFRAVEDLKAMDVPVIRHFVINGYDTLDNRLVYAAAAGQVDLIEPLIRAYDLSIRNRGPKPIMDVIPIICAAFEAARNGHVDVIRSLPIDRILDGDLGRIAQVAARNGHAEVLTALQLDRRLSDEYLNEIAKGAAWNGHAEVLRALPIDRLDNVNLFIVGQFAARNGHPECLAVLERIPKA